MDDEKLRVDVGITVEPDTEVSGEVGKRDIPAGRYAVGRFETGSDGFGESWNAMYKDWLPSSRYLPDDRLSFELYHNDHREHPEGKHIYDICIPVKPME